jgi:hypothetical protein
MDLKVDVSDCIYIENENITQQNLRRILWI